MLEGKVKAKKSTHLPDHSKVLPLFSTRLLFHWDDLVWKLLVVWHSRTRTSVACPKDLLGKPTPLPPEVSKTPWQGTLMLLAQHALSELLPFSKPNVPETRIF
eukprot:c14246_g1_i1.p1 GENE.c14246_g1_i1~~c14246_g1_i1.p1  ORF type:complete len:103 (-),score=19.35 c14246_g1_i1:16-324(-)